MSLIKMNQLYCILFLIFTAKVMADEKYLENLLHDGNNQLTTRMFSVVANANKEKSFILSAYLVLTPLAQLGLVSVEEAQEELLQTIGMPDNNTTKEVFSLANKKLRSIKGITLKTASKIYVAKSFELNSEFAADTRETFGSEVENINFLDGENAAKEVNTWVEEQTNNRIKDLVNPDILTQDTRALLVNAIYFKGSWKDKFEKHITNSRDFFVNPLKIIKVPMMYRSGTYKYAESQELKSQIIEIPYEGDESSLVIVLPNAKDGINEVKELFKDPNILEKTLRDMWETEVELYIPKFKIETTIDLKKALLQMNVTRMFNEKIAKLDNLLKSTGDLCVDSATQKAFIEVNEEGAEAAAANVFSVGYIGSVGAGPRIIRFIADHPFLFFLRGRENILFSGIFYS